MEQFDSSATKKQAAKPVLAIQIARDGTSDVTPLTLGDHDAILSARMDLNGNAIREFVLEFEDASKNKKEITMNEASLTALGFRDPGEEKIKVRATVSPDQEEGPPVISKLKIDFIESFGRSLKRLKDGARSARKLGNSWLQEMSPHPKWNFQGGPTDEQLIEKYGEIPTLRRVEKNKRSVDKSGKSAGFAPSARSGEGGKFRFAKEKKTLFRTVLAVASAWTRWQTKDAGGEKRPKIVAQGLGSSAVAARESNAESWLDGEVGVKYEKALKSLAEVPLQPGDERDLPLCDRLSESVPINEKGHEFKVGERASLSRSGDGFLLTQKHGEGDQLWVIRPGDPAHKVCGERVARDFRDGDFENRLNACVDVAKELPYPGPSRVGKNLWYALAKKDGRAAFQDDDPQLEGPELSVLCELYGKKVLTLWPNPDNAEQAWVVNKKKQVEGTVDLDLKKDWDSKLAARLQGRCEGRLRRQYQRLSQFLDQDMMLRDSLRLRASIAGSLGAEEDRLQYIKDANGDITQFANYHGGSTIQSFLTHEAANEVVGMEKSVLAHCGSATDDPRLRIIREDLETSQDSWNTIEKMKETNDALFFRKRPGKEGGGWGRYQRIPVVTVLQDAADKENPSQSVFDALKTNVWPVAWKGNRPSYAVLMTGNETKIALLSESRREMELVPLSDPRLQAIPNLSAALSKEYARDPAWQFRDETTDKSTSIVSPNDTSWEGRYGESTEPATKYYWVGGKKIEPANRTAKTSVDAMSLQGPSRVSGLDKGGGHIDNDADRHDKPPSRSSSIKSNRGIVR